MDQYRKLYYSTRNDSIERQRSLLDQTSSLSTEENQKLWWPNIHYVPQKKNKDLGLQQTNLVSSALLLSSIITNKCALPRHRKKIKNKKHRILQIFKL